jgi:hypothetical protein
LTWSSKGPCASWRRYRAWCKMLLDNQRR